MKALLIGDFHGKVPPNLKSKIKKEKFDYILCTGDLAGEDKLRELIFKSWDKLKRGKKLKDIIGQKRLDNLEKSAARSIKEPIKFLDSLKKKTFLIYGNWDYVKSAKGFPLGLKDLLKNKRNFILIHKKKIRQNDVIVLGFSGYRYPTEKGLEKTRSYGELEIRRINNLWNKKLKKLFSNLGRKKAIFLVHDPPRGIKFDLVKNKKSPLNHKHIGDEYFTKYIKKYKPTYCICGHMHEYQGKDKIGETTIINPGPAFEGKFAILDLEKDKIRFIK